MKWPTLLCLASISVALAGAQTGPPTPPVLDLVKVPEDGIAYYQTRQRAESLLNAGSYQEAEPLVERLVREYPRDGVNWLLFASTKRLLNKPAEAAAAYTRSRSILGTGHLFLQEAGQYLAAGDKQRALEILRLEVLQKPGIFRRQVYDHPSLASLRSDPEFLRIVGRPDTKGWTRNRGWTEDLDHLYFELKRTNPDYQNKPLPKIVEQRYRDLRRGVPKLSDEQITVEMARMLAPLRQGHVTLFPPPNAKMLPLHFYVFPEGVFVVDADEANRGLIGSKLLGVEKTPIAEAMEKMKDLRSADGDMEHLWTGPYLLRQMTFLKGLGITSSVDTAELTLQAPGKSEQKVQIRAIPVARWPKLVAPATAPAPLFLKDVSRVRWQQALPEHDALYLQINNFIDAPDETQAAYGQRLFRELTGATQKNLIVDLRHNNGGRPNYEMILLALANYSRLPDRRLYVLIGRGTYSAAGMFVTELDRLGSPIFVGEATSEYGNIHGDPAPVVLPYSGIGAELTAVIRPMAEPWDARRELSPDVPVQLTAADYFAGRDTVLETVFQLMRGLRSR